MPGTSQVLNWVLNGSGASPAVIDQVTVPGTTETISESSSAPSASPDLISCNGIVAVPYQVGTSIISSGSVICDGPVVINDLLRLWDYYNNSTYELIESTVSAGITVDYPQGTAACASGYAPRNSFHDDLNTDLTWPPGYPPTAPRYAVSAPVPLPCNQ